MSDLVRELFTDQVPITDNTDDSEWRWGLILEIIFLRFFFFSSGNQWETDGRGNGEAIATDSLAHSATSLITTSSSSFEMWDNTASSITIAFATSNTFLRLVVTWATANSNDSLIQDSALRMENRRLLRVRSATLVNVVLWSMLHDSNASVTVLAKRYIT